MGRRILTICCIVSVLCALLIGCGNQVPASDSAAQAEDAASGGSVLEDGVYLADFDTDGSMFHVNETCDGKGTLTVSKGSMTIHIVMPSKNVLNLFLGTAADAQAEGAVLLAPVTETVEYDDGTSEEVYAFDVPVPALDTEFDCALIGKKGVWYDHKVSVSNPVKAEDASSASVAVFTDGSYRMDVALEGGSGKASVASPADILVENGRCFATVVWSSSHYEYMLIGDTRYDPLPQDGNSAFLIPIVPDVVMEVSALTTAMSQPHLIDYTLYFDSSTMKAA